jgi:hypothetical protein
MTSEQPPTEPTASTDATTADATSADATATTPAPPATTESAAPTAPPPPSGAPVTAASGGGFSVGPGQIITALGALAVGVACFLDWLRAGDGLLSAKADVVPWDFLWHKTSTSTTSLLVWLIPIAALIAVAAIVPQLRFVALAGGIAALAVAGLYAYQLNGLIDLQSRDIGSVYDRLGIGDYVVAGGGFLAVVGTLVPRPSRSSR